MVLYLFVFGSTAHEQEEDFLFIDWLEPLLGLHAVGPVLICLKIQIK